MDIINKLNKKGNVTMEDILYHGSKMIVSEPEIRKSRFTKDFSWGFYCTNRRKQAEIWSVRHCETGYVSVYKFHKRNDLKIKVFSTTDAEWLDFVAKCRNGDIHEYDIVEGPMADDTIYNYVEDYLDGKISKDDFLQLASNITKEEAENKIIGLHEAYFDIKGNKGHASLVAGIDEEAGDVDSMYQLVLQRKGNLSAIEDEMDGK